MAVEEARRAAVREAEARRRGIEPWQLEMAEAVPSDLVGDIVRDQTRAAKPEAAEPVRRGSGWAPERPLDPPPGVAIMDQMMDAQDAVDRSALAKRLGG